MCVILLATTSPREEEKKPRHPTPAGVLWALANLLHLRLGSSRIRSQAIVGKKARVRERGSLPALQQCHTVSKRSVCLPTCRSPNNITLPAHLHPPQFPSYSGPICNAMQPPSPRSLSTAETEKLGDASPKRWAFKNKSTQRGGGGEKEAMQEPQP